MKRNVLLISLLLFSVILAGCLSVKGISERNLSISGIVLDDDGKPVGGVEIIVASGLATTTVSDGKWHYSAAKKGDEVQAHKTGFRFSPSDPIRVVQDKQEINFKATAEVSKTYQISGRVVDNKKEPVEDAIILLTDAQEGVIRTITSDSNGFFSIADLTGTYTATISKQGWVFTPESHHIDRFATNINFYGIPDIESTYAISGLILVDGGPDDGKGLVAVNIIIEFLDYPNVAPKHTVTDSAGAWEMDGLVGEIRVTPVKNGYSFTPGHQIADKAVITIGFTAKPAP